MSPSLPRLRSFASLACFAFSAGVLACGASSSGSTPPDDASAAPPPASGSTDAGSRPSEEHDSGKASTPPKDAATPRDAAKSAAPEPGSADAAPQASLPRLVGYLPDYNGSFTGWATQLDFTKMTHLNLAFAYPPTCNGTCTANSDMTFSIDSQSDDDIAAIVGAAHAAGVRVMLSIGGGGTDQNIVQFFQAGLATQLVASLDPYVSAHDFDGVDLDIESPGSMGAPYAALVSALVSTFRPEGKLVTGAMAQWIQSGVPDSALHQFDFIDVMTYSTLSDAQNDMAFYTGLNVPKNQIVLGVEFYGDVQDPADDEPEYSQILNAYPDAWQSDSVSGGSYYGGDTILYTGEATMAKETLLGAGYGGIMIWELTGDAPAPHSLLNVIQTNL